ncbi:hypothetical protein MTR67_017996, partial [Solanum verrucosum]
ICHCPSTHHLFGSPATGVGLSFCGAGTDFELVAFSNEGVCSFSPEPVADLAIAPAAWAHLDTEAWLDSEPEAWVH